jgi:putative ABC transport system permease protein
MFDLERAIKQWRKTLRKNEAMEDGYIIELESHLRDEVEHQLGLGMDSEEAFEKAVKDMGSADGIGTEYYKFKTTRASGRPPWKKPDFMPDLIWNYFKIAWRRIRRHKGFAFINIAGLALGMACAIIILLWVQNELSYDRFHENRDSLFRVAAFVTFPNSSAHTALGPPPLAPALKEEFSEIIQSTRFDDCPRIVFRYQDKAYYEEKGVLVDPSFFEMFTFPFIQGNPQTALSDPFSVILTAKTAAKYFGTEDPLSKDLLIEGQLMKVTGVLKDVPENSHIQFNFVLPFELKRLLGDNIDYWGNTNTYAYVQLNKEANPAEVDKKIENFLSEKLATIFRMNKPFDVKMYLQPISDIHLSSYISDQNYAVVSDSKYVYIFSIVAFFILIVACINFMNLFTARSMKRAKEIAMRKIVGSNRAQLIKQFLAESLLFSFFSLLAALVVVHTFLPMSQSLLNKNVSVNLLNFKFIISLLSITFLTGILAGSYPALFLSSLSSIRILKGRNLRSRGQLWVRKLLVIAQFSLSIILVIATIMIYKQIEFMRNTELGFDKENVVYMPLKGNISKHYETFKNELLQEPSILSISAKNSHPLEASDYTTDIEWPGKDPSQQIIMEATGVDYDYIETMKLEMKEGRSFSREYPTDVGGAFILNEKAVELMGLKSPLGKEIKVWRRKGIIIGIMKNAHFRSLKQQIEPQIQYLYSDLNTQEMNEFGVILVRIKKGQITEALASLKKIWREMETNYPFEFGFLDQSVDNQYRNERQISRIINIFTALALFISCLGLFGLASFMAEQRTKEIGVRKILGASVSQILRMLSTDFAKWVILASIVAWPLAYFILREWLGQFAYRVNLGIEIFLLSTLFTLLVALSTVSYQALKAATSNPVESLRYE